MGPHDLSVTVYLASLRRPGLFLPVVDVPHGPILRHRRQAVACAALRSGGCRIRALRNNVVFVVDVYGDRDIRRARRKTIRLSPPRSTRSFAPIDGTFSPHRIRQAQSATAPSSRPILSGAWHQSVRVAVRLFVRLGLRLSELSATPRSALSTL